MEQNSKNLMDDYLYIHRWNHSKQELFYHLCDICETSYHEPIDSLLQNLKNRLA